MNDEPNEVAKPTLAAGMAKRSFWIAVAAGWCGIICRMEMIGQAAQALLSLLTTALLFIAIIFGAVALIRISSADRKAVLMPALGGVLLGLAVLGNMTYWTRDRWVRARIKASQMAANGSGSPVQPANIPEPKSTIQYALPAFDHIPQATTEIRAGAARSKGDDSGVLRAWAAHLEKLHAAYTNTWAASNKLHEVELLDPKLISNLEDRDEPVRRRGLANQYADAWRLLDEKLSTFAGAYYNQLLNERVSSERWTVEGKALSSFVEQPEAAARVAALRKLCAAEQEVGHHYNYAVSAVFNYALIASRMPNPSPEMRRQMDQKVAKLKEKEQAAADARREAFQ